MTTITESELGWLAGIADGEGSFFLCLTKYSHSDAPSFKASFAVGNTNEYIILELKRLLSVMTGRERRYVPAKVKGNCKRAWLIQLTKQEDLRVFCEAMMPYLIGKKEQAKTMLEFIALGLAHRNGTQSMDQGMFEKRKALVAKMKYLNHREGNIERASLSANDRTVSSHRDEETVCSVQECTEATEMSARQTAVSL